MLEKIRLFQRIVGVDSYQSLEELINIKMLPQLQENVVISHDKRMWFMTMCEVNFVICCVPLPNVKLSFLM
jgi:hypothetical protein